MELMRLVLFVACCFEVFAATAGGAFNSASLNHIDNVTYAGNKQSLSEISSIFSPRMDFDQWKPLTGRGDPLLNDPTYDYEPPVLERVHYWADDPRPDREHRPERKSEVLMLGISSRKPSVVLRQPPRRHHRPPPSKYEDFSYKLSENYPMTILVPPPPPPIGHQHPLFLLTEEKITTPSHIIISTKKTNQPSLNEHTQDATHLTSLYALQEANLIYQSSTTDQNWKNNFNGTNPVPINAVSSDYAGWGPTTPIKDEDEESTNDKHNFIFNDNLDLSKHPFSFYRPMLSEAPPPPEVTPNPLFLSSFVPTALPPPTTMTAETSTFTETTTETYEVTTEFKEHVPTDKLNYFQPTSLPFSMTHQQNNNFGMMGSMLTMPLVNGPERQEDNMYGHTLGTKHLHNKLQKTDEMKIESMQAMHPPPPSKTTESTTLMQKLPFHLNSHMFKNPQKVVSMNTLDPYIHMRFTTLAPTIASVVDEDTLLPTEVPAVPTYLIIQGHSKVKTYSSKQKKTGEQEAVVNEIPKPNETNEVKHLHPLKDKHSKKSEISDHNRNRTSRARNLKSLLDHGIGSIEIQEANLGIKYDISDGSEVPVELYRKGIVENDENDYSVKNKSNRTKRQLELEDLLPFDEEQLEEYVFKFLEGKKNDTGITGLIASAVTSDAADAIDDIEDEEDEEDDDR